MPAVLLTMFLLALSAPSLMAAAEQENAMDYSAVASAISEFFSVSGVTVFRVEGNDVFLQGTGKLRPGMRLGLHRGGQVFKHPVTGEPFGTGEKEVGLIEVISIDAAGTRASLVSGSAEEGDKARLEVSTARILVAYQDNIDPSPVDRLYVELEKISGLALLDGGSGTIEAALSKGWEKGAHALVYLGERRGKTAVSLYMPGQDASKPAEEWVLEYDAPVLEPLEEEHASRLTEIPWFHFTLPFRAYLLASGDVDGDGKENLVVSARGRLVIYGLEKHELRDINTIKISTRSDVFDLSLFDLDNNGASEIIVTTVEEQGRGATTDDDINPESPAAVQVRTLIYGFSPDSGFERKGLLTGFFGRATEQGVLLQAYSARDGIGGPLYMLQEEGTGFGKRLIGDPPEGSNLYNFARMGEITVSLMGAGNLVLTDSAGNAFWTSAETFGGGEPSFTLPARMGQTARKISRRMPVLRKNVASRDFFTFKNNHILGAVPGFGFKSSDIYGFRLGDREVTDLWSFKDLAARVNGMTVLKDGRLVALLSPTITGSKALFGSKLAYFKNNSVLMIMDPRRRQ